MNRRLSLAIGSAVLAGVAVVCWQLLAASQTHGVPLVESDAKAEAPVLLPVVPAAAPAASASAPAQAEHDTSRCVQGIVRLPDGQPATGATVMLYRAQSAWPEWRKALIDQATTPIDGRFLFRSERATDLLVAFELPGYAGDVVEAPPLLQALDLRLQPGFDLSGVVTNDAGLPMANCRVAIEAATGDTRRVVWAVTSGTGRFRFSNLQSGGVRVVARHERWQPTQRANVTIGVDTNIELRFAKPALFVEGRVVAAASQQPVAGATVSGLPTGGQLGLTDPVRAATASDGSFRLAGLAPGNLRIEVRHPDHATVSRVLVVGTATPSITFELPPRSIVRGRLTDPGGLLAKAGGPVQLRLETVAGEIGLCEVQGDGSFAFPGAMSAGRAEIVAVAGRIAFANSGDALTTLRILETVETPVEFTVAAPAVITGSVRDAGGPAAGARVYAPSPGKLTAARSLQLGVQLGTAFMERMLSQQGDGGGPSFEVATDRLIGVTGADGAFRIAGLRPGQLTLRVVKEGWGTRKLEVVVAPGELRCPEIALPPPCSLSGRVVRAGRPLTGAMVTVTGDEVQATVATGSNGAFALEDLPPGSYRVRARYATLPPVAAPSPVVLRAAERTPPVILAFATGRVLSGQVVGTDDQPVPRALVMVRGSTATPVLTDAFGNFLVEVPPRGAELEIVVGERGTPQIVAVPDDAERRTIAVATPPVCSLTARIFGLPGRKPLPGVLLRLVGDGPTDVPEARWFELAGGELEHPWFPAGRVRLWISCEGYAPYEQELELAPGTQHSLDEILLEPGCRLQGRILDPQGAPVAGAEVFLGDEMDLEQFAPHTRSDGDGKFVLSGVASAAATVVARAAGFATHTQRLSLPQDVLGSAPFVLRLSRGATIIVQAPPQFGEGALAVLRRNGRMIASSALDEQGTTRFQHRSPGKYEVRLLGRDADGVEVVVDESGQDAVVRLAIRGQ